MKILMVLISILFITGCLPRSMQPPPTGWNAFRVLKHKNITPEIIKEDMIACGFDNPYTSYIEDDEQGIKYIKAVLCMESKGHLNRSLPKGVCHRYPDSSVCQARQTEIPNEHLFSRAYCRPCQWNLLY